MIFFILLPWFDNNPVKRKKLEMNPTNLTNIRLLNSYTGRSF
ncbi:hypothetical protein EZS27_040252 [termite gut metagenome]|uniref:Uncharacterized protein n=1 Tax=termite gut metagenome TaxID=433724 RepID=A0A5J4PHW5_9ZZZZ